MTQVTPNRSVSIPWSGDHAEAPGDKPWHYSKAGLVIRALARAGIVIASVALICDGMGLVGLATRL